MNYIVTSMYDEKTRQYMAPQLDANHDTARRNFSYALKRNDTLAFAKADLRLYDLGDFDTDTGVFTPNCPAILIVDGKELADE